MESRRITKVLQRRRKPKPAEPNPKQPDNMFRGMHPIYFYKGYRGATKLRKLDKDWAYIKVNYLALHCEHCPYRRITDRVRKPELVLHLLKCKGLKQGLKNVTQKYHHEDVFYHPTELQSRENILKQPLTYIDPENDWLIPMGEVARNLQIMNDRISDLTRRMALTVTLVTSHVRGKFCSDMAGILPNIIGEQTRLNEEIRTALESTSELDPQVGFDCTDGGISLRDQKMHAISNVRRMLTNSTNAIRNSDGLSVTTTASTSVEPQKKRVTSTPSSPPETPRGTSLLHDLSNPLSFPTFPLPIQQASKPLSKSVTDSDRYSRVQEISEKSKSGSTPPSPLNDQKMQACFGVRRMCTPTTNTTGTSVPSPLPATKSTSVPSRQPQQQRVPTTSSTSNLSTPSSPPEISRRDMLPPPTPHQFQNAGGSSSSSGEENDLVSSPPSSLNDQKMQACFGVRRMSTPTTNTTGASVSSPLPATKSTSVPSRLPQQQPVPFTASTSNLSTPSSTSETPRSLLHDLPIPPSTLTNHKASKNLHLLKSFTDSGPSRVQAMTIASILYNRKVTEGDIRGSPIENPQVDGVRVKTASIAALPTSPESLTVNCETKADGKDELEHGGRVEAVRRVLKRLKISDEENFTGKGEMTEEALSAGFKRLKISGEESFTGKVEMTEEALSAEFKRLKISSENSQPTLSAFEPTLWRLRGIFAKNSSNSEEILDTLGTVPVALDSLNIDGLEVNDDKRGLSENIFGTTKVLSGQLDYDDEGMGDK